MRAALAHTDEQEIMMRLLIVGTLKGQLTTATKIAMDNGASVTHAEGTEQAMAVLRDLRSEERRVGKECRSRWSPYH